MKTNFIEEVCLLKDFVFVTRNLKNNGTKNPAQPYRKLQAVT